MFKPSADFHVGLTFKSWGIDNVGHITGISRQGVASWYYDSNPRAHYSGTRVELHKIIGI